MEGMKEEGNIIPLNIACTDFDTEKDTHPNYG